MGSGGKITKVVSTILDPVGTTIAGKVAKANPNNKVAAVLTPGAYQQNRLDAGEPVTARLVGDPGALFTQTEEQKKQAAAAAEAEAENAQTTAENDATETANNALIARKKRRQSGLGALATGAQGGTGQLSTANAYGKSALGS